MLEKLLERNRERSREEGFSLIEIMVGIVVIGILAAIVVPMYLNAKAESDSATIKSAVQSAAILIEQEALDNNGLYPTYFPNELKANPRMATFVYSYSDSRTNFCIQAPAPVGKLFISAKNKTVVSTSCTENNIAEGGATPWQIPTITTPAMPTVTNAWASNQTASISTIQIGTAVCTLKAEDQSEWASKTTVQYRVKVTNTSRAGEFYYTNWDANRNLTTTLTTWLPAEIVTYEAQARCLISNGIDYSYASPFSATTTRAIAVFVVVPPAFITTTAAWLSDTEFRATGSWGDAFCPAGVKQSLLSVVDTTTSAALPFSSTWSAWRTSLMYDATSWSSGGTTRFSHTVGCLLPNGVRVTSVPVVRDVVTALRPPLAPATLSSNNAQGSTLVVPNNVLWSAVTCITGTPQYNLQQSTPNGSQSSGWIASLNEAQEHLAGTVYGWRVQARCAVGAQVSIPSAFSNALSYTAQYSTAPAPLSAPVPNSSNPYVINTNATFTFGSNTCPAGTTQTNYRLYRNGVFLAASTTNTIVSAVPATAGTYSYTYTLICNIGGFQTVESDDSPARSVSVINLPAAPSNFTNPRVYLLTSYFSWSSVSGAAKYELLYNGTTVTINNTGAATYSTTAIGTVRNKGYVNGYATAQPATEAQPQARVRAVNAFGNASAWATINVDTPRARLYGNVQNNLFPNNGGLASSSNTRSGNSMVAADGRNFVVQQNDRNFVRYTSAGVAQAATSFSYGGSRFIDRIIFDANGDFQWWEYANDRYNLRHTNTTNNDMMVMEDDAVGGDLKFYRWTGSYFMLTRSW